VVEYDLINPVTVNITEIADTLRINKTTFLNARILTELLICTIHNRGLVCDQQNIVRSTYVEKLKNLITEDVLQ